jgi:hypothetical protein
MRGLLLVVLGLAVAGFGVCSLCGGVMGLATLTENTRSSRDIAWLAFGCSAIGAVIAVAAFFGFRALWRQRKGG